jgi:DNA repair protein RecO (recombination protein O)
VPLVSTRAAILQAFPYSDTSKILRILSGEHGVRSVLARGAMRPKNRFGGVLEPFTEGDAHFLLKQGRDLHTLNGFDLVRARQGIGRSLGAFAGASLIAEIVLRFGTDEAQPELFAAVTRSFDALANPAADHPVIALSAVWGVVAIFGYEPELEACVICGRPVAPDEVTRFDVRAGGVACTRCRTEGRLVPVVVRDELHALIRGAPVQPEPSTRGVHRSLLSAFLTAHLASDRPLRSLELFLEEIR